MKISRKVLADVGECIYCRTKREPLRTEHIVPYGLNGPWELLRATCDKCAKITSRFEQDVLRNILLPVRSALQFPTRRKRGRPSEFPLTIERSGQEELIQVPAEDFATMILPLFKVPAFLDRRSYKQEINMTGIATIQVKGLSLGGVMKKYRTKRISFQVSYQPMAFARLLAKIAYGFAVAKFGLGKIKEAYVVPAILGETMDTGRWVGCAPVERLRGEKYLHVIGVVSIKGRIHAHVKLFAPFNAPEYLVVVGRLP